MNEDEEEFVFTWKDILALMIALFESLLIPFALLVIVVVLIVLLLRAVFL